MRNILFIWRLFIFFLCFTYSYVRYIVFGNVDTIDIPTVILNKDIAFSIVIYLLFLYKKNIQTF